MRRACSARMLCARQNRQLILSLMTSRGRVLRLQFHSRSLRHQSHQYPPIDLRARIRSAHCQLHPHTTRDSLPRAQPQPTPAPSPSPRRGAIDSLSFVIALAVSAGVAYLTTKYTSTNTSSPELASDHKISIAPSAQEFYLVMAPSMPPGRPGTLTADQEAKLKDMWIAVMDVFGMTRETHANGIAVPSSETIPDPKKKKKSRLSMFKKDKHSDGDSHTDGDNDKHGQTKEFQQALASLSSESIREAFWSMTKHDHPDALLLRFLRARKWDVQAALIMMISTLHWRIQEMHLDDDIMTNGEGAALRESKSSNAAEKKEGNDFLAQLRIGKSFLHGLDKEGRPCCYVRVRLHRQGEQSERSLERYTVYTIETTRMMLRPPVDTAVYLPELQPS